MTSDISLLRCPVDWLCVHGSATLSLLFSPRNTPPQMLTHGQNRQQTQHQVEGLIFLARWNVTLGTMGDWTRLEVYVQHHGQYTKINIFPHAVGILHYDESPSICVPDFIKICLQNPNVPIGSNTYLVGHLVGNYFQRINERSIFTLSFWCLFPRYKINSFTLYIIIIIIIINDL